MWSTHVKYAIYHGCSEVLLVLQEEALRRLEDGRERVCLVFLEILLIRSFNRRLVAIGYASQSAFS